MRLRIYPAGKEGLGQVVTEGSRIGLQCKQSVLGVFWSHSNVEMGAGRFRCTRSGSGKTPASPSDSLAADQ